MHRNECRGVGGTFFKEMVIDDDFDKTLAFCRDSGNALIEVYREICLRQEERPFGEKEKAWQALRRGRYVEYNLVYD